jgi:nucleotide-binding universal stress UspA family protein
VDGSPCSEAAVREVIGRPWPPDTEVRIISVAHVIPFIPDPFLVGAASYFEDQEEKQQQVKAIVAKTAQTLSENAPQLRVSTATFEGSPKHLIVEEAERWNADLILLGSHGHGPVGRFLLGSVSQAVAAHAPCSVEIVRLRKASA